MNTPGVTTGNWRWMFHWEMLEPGFDEGEDPFDDPALMDEEFPEDDPAFGGDPALLLYAEYFGPYLHRVPLD